MPAGRYFGVFGGLIPTLRSFQFNTEVFGTDTLRRFWQAKMQAPPCLCLQAGLKGGLVLALFIIMNSILEANTKTLKSVFLLAEGENKRGRCLGQLRNFMAAKPNIPNHQTALCMTLLPDPQTAFGWRRGSARPRYIIRAIREISDRNMPLIFTIKDFLHLSKKICKELHSHRSN